jgi:Mg/Co/Ni transporter MgtE
LGYPTEGSVADRRRISQHVSKADAVPIDATVGDVAALPTQDYPVPVVDESGVVLGAVDPAAIAPPHDTPVADVMIPAPGTIRGEMRVEEVVQQLTKDGLDHVLVTAVNGTLIGRVVMDELHV